MATWYIWVQLPDLEKVLVRNVNSDLFVYDLKELVRNHSELELEKYKLTRLVLTARYFAKH